MTTAWFAAAAFAISGLALAGALIYLARRVARLRQALSTIDTMWEADRDPFSWPERCWPTLSTHGVRALAVTGCWFGQPLNRRWGSAPPDAEQRTVRWVFSGDVELHAEVCLAGRGEDAFFATIVWEATALRWRSAAQEIVAGVHAASVQRAWLALDLQHELRNLAQWLVWLCDDLEAEESTTSLAGLRAKAPLLRTRAAALLERTRLGDAASGGADRQPLDQLLRATALFYAVDIELDTGTSPSPAMPRSVVLPILDELFANLRKHAAGGFVLIRIKPSPHLVTLEIHPGSTAPERLGRIFEPFHSGDADGLGLGLYLARQKARQQGGDLRAEPEPFRFVLTLPVSEGG